LKYHGYISLTKQEKLRLESRHKTIMISGRLTN